MAHQACNVDQQVLALPDVVMIDILSKAYPNGSWHRHTFAKAEALPCEGASALVLRSCGYLIFCMQGLYLSVWSGV